MDEKGVHAYLSFKCPKCESGRMIEKFNSVDKSIFYGCSNYNGNNRNSCKHTFNIKIEGLINCPHCNEDVKITN